jgi:hypothetical protein
MRALTPRSWALIAGWSITIGTVSRGGAQDLPLATGSTTKGGIVARIVVRPGRDEKRRDLANYALILFRANHDSTIVTADDNGRITMIVPAGDYQLASVAPIAFDGGQYVWNIPLRVYSGMAVVELTATNAQPAAIPDLARATPVFSRPSPTVRNALDRTPAPADGGAGPTVVGPPGPCCMKDPAAAVMFSVIFPGGGQFYNGSIGKGILFFILEVGGAVALESGASTYNNCHNGFGSDCSSNQTLEYVGLGVVVGSWIGSLADACGTAHRHNRNLGLEPRVALLIAPASNGRADIGLRVALR